MACLNYSSVGIGIVVVLLICTAFTVGVSPLYFIFFVAVCPWCICTGIASAFIYASFSDTMRADMPCFSGTTLAHIIATSCRILDRCSTLCGISSKSLHTLCKKCFPPIHIQKSLLEFSSCGPDTAINGPCPSIEYSRWPNIVDSLGLINLSTMAPLVLPRDLSTMVFNKVSKLSMINSSGGGVPSQFSIFFSPAEQILFLY